MDLHAEIISKIKREGGSGKIKKDATKHPSFSSYIHTSKSRFDFHIPIATQSTPHLAEGDQVCRESNPAGNMPRPFQTITTSRSVNRGRGRQKGI
jgi:hypothetical protein